MPLGPDPSGKDRGPAGISRRSLTFGVLAIMFAGRGAMEAAAQAKSGTRKFRILSWGTSNEIEITALSVEVASAEQRQIAGGRLKVPVRIAWKTGPWGDRALLELRATLNVTDDKGVTVELTKELGVKDKEDTLVLDLEEGREPESYLLTLVGQCRFTDGDGKLRVEPTTAELAGRF